MLPASAVIEAAPDRPARQPAWTQVSNAERQAIWETLLLRSDNGKLKYGEYVRVGSMFGVDYRVVERIWKRGMETMGPRVAAAVKSRSNRRGRKKKDRNAICAKLRAIPVDSRKNQRILQINAGVSCYLVQQLITEGYLRHCIKQTRPLLTNDHRVDRVEFCLRHVLLGADGVFAFDELYNLVHIDEKWFYVKKIGQKLYIMTGLDGLPIEDPPVQFAQSKRYIIKVMFLCAVARPRVGFDGLIGIWPVVEPYTTKRRSKKRDAGVEILKPVKIDREKSREMLIGKVIPAIKDRWPHQQKHMEILIQQDNASPHVLPNDIEVLAAANSDGWRMRFSSQPAQSPDLNVLDLGFFNSIQSLQDRTTPQTEEELIADVERAYWSSSPVTLNKTFLTLQFMMEHIMMHDGKNDFRLGHLKKEALLRVGRLPTTLQCDPAAYIQAHTFLLDNPRSTPRAVTAEAVLTDVNDVLCI